MLDLKVKVDSSEAERDYYYDKLRSIEILCQMPELQDVGVSPPTRFCLSHDPREISLPMSRRMSILIILSATSPKSLNLTEVLPKSLSSVCSGHLLHKFSISIARVQISPGGLNPFQGSR